MNRWGWIWVFVVSCVLSGSAQVPSATSDKVVVPPLVNFSGTLTDLNGKPLTGTVGVTFLLYRDAQGGAPLWLETQNVQPDKTGHYTVMLGSTSSHGLPADIFVAGEAHWLGVQVQRRDEQARVLLVSTPYALKAGDAETLGGLPVSAFVLAGTPSAASNAPAGSSSVSAGANGAPPATTITGSGTVGFVPLWDSASDITSSVVFQSGSGSTAKVGINTTTPTATLDVKGGSTIRGALTLTPTGNATAAAGKNSEPTSQSASSFSSSTSLAVNQTFQWQAEPAGNNTATPSGTLNLLFGSGSSSPAETGLNIASNGQITFASGQTFPGAGTITGVTTAAGSGLMGGGSTGALNLALTNTCAASQVLQWNGAAWACATVSSGGGTITGVTAGTDLTGGGTSGNVTVSLNTASTDARYSQLGAANTFTKKQTISAAEDISASSTSQVLNVNQSGTGTTGDAIHGVTSSPGGTGVFGEGAIALQGFANPSTGLAGLFRGTVKTTGNGIDIYAGDPGCGSGYGGVGFSTSSGLAGCTNYALIGGTKGDTYINSSLNGHIHFRSNNNELGSIDNTGNMNLTGNTGGGNITVVGTVTGKGSTTGTGIEGKTSNVGVYGSSAGASKVGSRFGTAGIWGDTGGTAGNGYSGVLGTADGNSAGAFYNNSIYPTLLANNANFGNAVQGTSLNVGVFGSSNGTAATASNLGQAGVWGTTGGGGSYFGVLGTSDSAHAGVFWNNGTNSTLYVENDSTTGAFVFWTLGGAFGDAGCTIDTSGNLVCIGNITGASAVGSGTRKVAMYATEATENWLEDAGSGQLSHGSARITLDSTFADTVNTSVDYHVFLTPGGDCKGLYVSRKSATAFEVHELGGGTSSIAFDYRIMAKRKGAENLRMADLTESYRQQAIERNEMRQRPGAGNPQLTPAVPPRALQAQKEP